jgi:hypothetical protein
VKAAVEGNHLAFEGVERAEAEVAVLSQLGEGDIAVVGALQQRADPRGLKQHVRLVLGGELCVMDGLDVQGTRQALVDHGTESASWGACVAGNDGRH